MNTTTPIQTPEASTRRPVIITVLCVLGCTAAVGNVARIFTDAVRNMGAWFQLLLTLSVVMTVICMIGLWKMRRWAVFVYTGLALAGLVIALMTGTWNITAQLVRAAVIAVLFSQISKMR